MLGQFHGLDVSCSNTDNHCIEELTRSKELKGSLAREVLDAISGLPQARSGM